VTTEGEDRDVDPVQFRWAGVPRCRAFQPMDVRQGQREFINVLQLSGASCWRLVTLEDPHFDPGFATDLPVDERHQLQISVFADNARAVAGLLLADTHPTAQNMKLELIRS